MVYKLTVFFSKLLEGVEEDDVTSGYMIKYTSEGCVLNKNKFDLLELFLVKTGTLLKTFSLVFLSEINITLSSCVLVYLHFIFSLCAARVFNIFSNYYSPLDYRQH